MKNLVIKKNDTIKKALELIKKNGAKGLVVINNKKQLIGSLSDGDIRKAILKNNNINKKIELLYNKKPTFLYNKNYSQKTLRDLFYKKNFTIVPIVGEFKKIKKIVTAKNLTKSKLLIKIKKNNLLKKVPCIIMAGGKGTRLEPFTHVLPKPLIPIKKKTVIEHIINSFKNHGVESFLISLNYKAEILKAYFKELKPNSKINFIAENKPLGTIGSLSKINKKQGKNFFVTNCDTISSINLNSMYKFHIKNNYDLTLYASSKNHQVPYGVCHGEANGDLIKIEEKPKFNFLVNVGLYLANNSILDYIPKNKNFQFTDLVKQLKKDNKKIGLYTEDKNSWLDVGQWDEFKKTVSIFS